MDIFGHKNVQIFVECLKAKRIIVVCREMFGVIMELIFKYTTYSAEAAGYREIGGEEAGNILLDRSVIKVSSGPNV